MQSNFINSNNTYNPEPPTCYVHLKDQSHNNQLRIMPLTAPLSLANFRSIHPETLSDVTSLIECHPQSGAPYTNPKHTLVNDQDMLLAGRHYIVSNNTNLNNQNMNDTKTKVAPSVTFNSIMHVREYSLSFTHGSSVSQSPSTNVNGHMSVPPLQMQQSYPRSGRLQQQQHQQQNHQHMNNNTTTIAQKVKILSCFEPERTDVERPDYKVPAFEGDDKPVRFNNSSSRNNQQQQENAFPMEYSVGKGPGAQRYYLESEAELKKILDKDFIGENAKLNSEFEKVFGR